MSLPDALTLRDLDYELPRELIAQCPVEPRDASRLLVVGRGVADVGPGRPMDGREGGIRDLRFSDLPGLLRRGDVIVRNDTRVFPARAFFRRATGGRIEVLFLRQLTWARADERWEALVRGRPRPGELLAAEEHEAWRLRCDERLGDGRWTLVNEARRPVLDLLGEVGKTPLPPYIHSCLSDGERYQTVYARAVGSAAAPTAGLHFTPAVDAALEAAGATIETVTLHVGLGTFKPLQEERLDDNRLHGERFSVESAAWRRIAAARDAGRRVIAVGTTTVRTLEHLALREDAASAPSVSPRTPGEAAATPAGAAPEGGAATIRGETALFIRPGFRFRVVDGLLTNFHLPRSSLLALVMAFAGVEATRVAYRHAVDERYRFYSFGDAMLVLP